MKPPLVARVLLSLAAGRERRAEVLGDLEESHRLRVITHGPTRAYLLTSVDAVDVCFALLRTGRFSVSLLDLKLGLRMLVKFPGLTLVGGLAIAFAVAVGAGTMQFASDLFRPSFDVEDGDRVVWLRLWDRERNEQHSRTAFDFAVWREELATVRDVGAFLAFRTNLGSDEHGAVPVLAAEITAAALSVARTPPYLGRPLSSEDEAPGRPRSLYSATTRGGASSPRLPTSSAASCASARSRQPSSE